MKKINQQKSMKLITILNFLYIMSIHAQSLE